MVTLRPFILGIVILPTLYPRDFHPIYFIWKWCQLINCISHGFSSSYLPYTQGIIIVLALYPKDCHHICQTNGHAIHTEPICLERRRLDKRHWPSRKTCSTAIKIFQMQRISITILFPHPTYSLNVSMLLVFLILFILQHYPNITI